MFVGSRLIIGNNHGGRGWGRFQGQAVLNQSQGQGWGRGGGGVVGKPGMRGEGGGRGFPNRSCDGGEGWDETVHMPASVTHVTEEHFVFVKGALACLALVIPGGGLPLFSFL